MQRRAPGAPLQRRRVHQHRPVLGRADNLRAIWNHNGSQIWAAAYNGDGLRVALQDTASGSFPTQHDFTWGLGGLLYDTDNSAVYTPGVSQRVNGTDSFFHTDWLGSTRYTSDSSGNMVPAALRYDAFGQRTDQNAPWDPTPFQFAAEWGYQSEFATGPEAGTGLQYLQNRYYDPAIGRFISPDPVGFLGGPNLYAYADNDPVNEADPSGLAARGRAAGPLQRAGQAIGRAFSFVLSLPGKAFSAVTGRLGHVTLRPDTPTLATTPLDPSGTGIGSDRQSGLRAAGGQINQFVEDEKEQIGNQAFWGAVGAFGAARAAGAVEAGQEIPWSSVRLRQVARALAQGATEVEVGSREEAEELFLNEYAGEGYRNTTGMTGNQVRNDPYLYPNQKTGTYHWDLADVMHGGRPHLQIHDRFGRIIRIFFPR